MAILLVTALATHVFAEYNTVHIQDYLCCTWCCTVMITKHSYHWYYTGSCFFFLLFSFEYRLWFNSEWWEPTTDKNRYYQLYMTSPTEFCVISIQLITAISTWFYLRHGEGYVSIVVRWFVCLSVCLLATLRKNGWTDVHEIFRVGGTWYKEKLRTFAGCSIQPLEHSNIFPLFRRNPCLLAAMQKNDWADFHAIFRKRRTWHKKQFATFSECYG